MATVYSAWSKEWLPKDAKAKRRFRARLDYGVNSETDTTIQYWARVYVEINPTLSTDWTGYLRFDSDSTVSASGKTYYKKSKVVQLVSTKYKTYTKGTSATTGKISFSVKKASGSIAGTTMSSSVNVTIPAKRYDISFNANGGSNPPASQKKVHGTNLTLTTGVPTRAGYDFVSWNTAADGSGTSYASGATFSTDAITTLYAQWHLSYVPPKVENLRAYRVKNGSSGYNPNVLSTGTKIYAEFKLTNPVSGTVTVSAKFGTTSQASSGTSGSIKYFYSSDGHLPATSSETVTFTLSVTDYKNNKYTYTYSTFVSKEIYIFDAFKGTSGSTEYQSFALGGSARDFGSSSRSSKGNFDCYMDADFKGNVDVTGNMNVLGRVTTGKAISVPCAHYSGTAGSKTINTASTFFKLSSFSGYNNSHMISDDSYFESDPNGFKVLKSGTYLLILNAHYNTSAASTQMTTRFLDYTGNVQVGYIMYNCNPATWGMLSNHVIAHIDANHIVVPEFQKYSTATSNWKPSLIKYSMILLTED